IDKAPRNSAGKVEFSADFYLLKPKDIARGNGAVLFEVSNRGGKGTLGFFNHGAGGADPRDPTTAAQMGDGFLMRQGFSLLWVDGPRRTVARDQWAFTQGGTGVTLAAKFEPNKIYEVVYAAENPPLVGLGPAAIRDTVALLKHGAADAWTIPAGAITRATAFGI